MDVHVDMIVAVHVVVCVMNVLFNVSFFCGFQPLTSVDVKTRTIFYSKKIKEIIPRNYLPRAGRGLQNLS